MAKGGEADDALKRVMLDFHTTQLVAQKQALIVLLSGEHHFASCFQELICRVAVCADQQAVSAKPSFGSLVALAM